MLRNYKLQSLGILLCILSLKSIAQTKDFKDVILDGKPAKLNLNTGEITIVGDSIGFKPIKRNTSSENTLSDKLVTDTISTSASSDYHIVKKGERLTEIAKNYNISLIKLMEANQLETTLVNEGRKLRVKNLDTSSKSSDEVDQERIAYHLIKRGETLYSISKRYNISVEKLKVMNGLSSNLIKEDEYLKIVDSIDEENNSIWIVTKGDTLYSIARKNNLSVDALKALNNLTNNTISIGQKLYLK